MFSFMVPFLFMERQIIRKESIIFRPLASTFQVHGGLLAKFEFSAQTTGEGSLDKHLKNTKLCSIEFLRTEMTSVLEFSN